MSRKHGSPVLKLHIKEEDWDKAIESQSGGCLIADAIKKQYPHLSSPVVDMATIRVSDRKRGERYTYLTPPAAQHLLLSFDQGWKPTEAEINVRQAVKITSLVRGDSDLVKTATRRAERLAELNAKVEAGEELTPAEKRSRTRMLNA